MSVDQRMREAFALFDRDGDGEVSGAEILLVIRSCGIMPSPEEKSKLPVMMNWQMMHDWLQAKLKTYNPEEQLVKAFHVFDRGNKGNIAADELGEVLKALGELLSEDEIKELIQEADPNKTGDIDYKAFTKYLLS